MKKDNKKQTLLSAKMKKCAERMISSDFDGNISKLCEELSISRSTFYRWYDKKEFKQYINFLIDKYTEAELFEIWKAIIDTAKKGSPQALKLFFDLKNLQSKKIESSGVVFISGEDRIEA
ncbi:MAG: hypothetical protein IJN56_01300 [Clostridia bacterium]|nr:hypothetical protein [Clostridia bacterium]